MIDIIKVEHIETWGFEHAIRGMRNPMNSWNRSDSQFNVSSCVGDPSCVEYKFDFKIGENDLDLMQRLYKAGPEHRKYLRQIFISMDVTAPLYWWKECDQYRVGITTNSCSTMHRIHTKEFALEDFSCEHLCDFNLGEDECIYSMTDGTFVHHMKRTVEQLNVARNLYLEAKTKPMKDESKRADYVKKCWWQMIQLLPSSYNQKRTITMTYENCVNIIHQRSGHKLDEWHQFVQVLRDLPLMELIIGTPKPC